MEYHAAYSLMNGLDYRPLPDYWIAVLFNEWMGRGVLNATSSDPLFRVYAHCHDTNGTADGSVVMAFVNIHSDKVSFQFDTDTVGTKHDDYILTPQQGHLGEAEILLNGELLSMSEDGMLPELKGKESEHNPISVEPYSVGFIHFKDAKVAICQKLL